MSFLHSNRIEQRFSRRFELSYGHIVAKIDGNHTERQQQFAIDKQRIERFLFEWNKRCVGENGNGISEFIQRSCIFVSNVQGNRKLFEICRHNNQSSVFVSICVQRTRFVFDIFHGHKQRFWRRTH